LPEKFAEAKPQFFAADVEDIIVAGTLNVHPQHAALG